MSSTDFAGGNFTHWISALRRRFPQEFAAIQEENFAASICRRVSVYDGWQQVVEATVLIFAKQNRVALNGELRIEDITKKDGALEINVTRDDDRVHGAIAAARLLSAMVCEKCGQPGVPQMGRNKTVSCAEHADGGEPDQARALSIFNATVREGVVEQRVLATLQNYDLAVEQCLVALAFFIGSTRGLEAERRGIQPRIVDFLISNERVLTATFEFDPSEFLRGFVECCRAYTLVCSRR